MPAGKCSLPAFLKPLSNHRLYCPTNWAKHTAGGSCRIPWRESGDGPLPIAGIPSPIMAARWAENAHHSLSDAAFHIGALYILIAQIAGFTIVWIWWWIAKR